VVAAALLRRTRVVAMEPNAVPGFTARQTARWTWRALVTFEEAAHYFPAGRTEVTGLPVRQEFFRLPARAPGDRFTAAAFARADLVVCRAGAGAVAELAAARKPALLVPFPFAADDHQLRNADAMSRAGAARVIEDANLTGERLCREIAALAGDRTALERMGEAARKLARPGAAERAAEILEEAIDLGAGTRNNTR
jgi:UDP-N-acetylglucosamine:LPS N-acetylglucosamine transferase